MTGFTPMIGLLGVASVPFLVEGMAACTFFPDPIRIALSYKGSLLLVSAECAVSRPRPYLITKTEVGNSLN
jgi:hypothetical protein